MSNINTNNMKISVIVPVYNTPEKYLKPCIESLLTQDYTNFEILIIDDGSNATCHTLLDEFSSTDSRVKVFHKPNAGVSSARNFGLAQITGDFLTFMDSDDVLDSHAWTTCMHALTQYNADVVCFGWQDHLADKTRIDHCITNDYSMSVPYKHIEYMKSVVPIEDTHADGTKHVYLPRTDATNQPLLCDSKTLLAEVASDNIHYGGGYPWNKVWRISALQDHNGCLPQFDEELTIYEDKLWVIEAVARISSAVLLPDIFYHYIFLPTSLTRKDTDIIDRQPLAYKAYDKILDFLETDYPDAYIAAYNFYFDVIFNDIHILKDASHSQSHRQQYLETMKIYKKLCKRLVPRTLYPPIRSPQFISWFTEHMLP